MNVEDDACAEPVGPPGENLCATIAAAAAADLDGSTSGDAAGLAVDLGLGAGFDPVDFFALDMILVSVVYRFSNL
jgi:hypothetical protein